MKGLGPFVADIMRDLIKLLTVLPFILIASCVGDENNDNLEEQSCSVAGGLWVQQSVTCADAETTTAPFSLNFGSATSSSTSRGSVDCITSTDWDMELGTQPPTMDLSGNGNRRCSQNGLTVSNCTGADNSCDNSISMNGVTNNFDVCVIQYGTMRLWRTATAALVTNGLTPCTAGQLEVRNLVSQATGGGAELSISEFDPFDFNQVVVGASVSHAFTVTNNGTGTANTLSGTGLAPPYSFLGGAYPGAGGSCSSTLAADDTCTIVLSFTPSVIGVAIDTVQINYHDGSNPRAANRDLTGEGISTAQITVTAPVTVPFSFGMVGIFTTSPPQLFTLQNTGSSPASTISGSGLAAPFSFQGGTYPGTTGTCGLTLAAGASCTVAIEFAPTMTGLQQDTFEINYNDGASAQTTQHDIEGIGI